jgi:uncharacterized protein
MAGPAGILRDIHRLRTSARDLQSRIDNAPRQLRAQQAAAGKHEENLRQAQEGLKKLKVAIHEKEVSVKSAQAGIKKHEQQLNDITSKKEYDALRSEIAEAKKRIVQLEDEELALMGELEERTAQLPALEKEIKQAKAEFAAFERDYQSRLDDWTRQRDTVVKQVADAEASLPKDIRQSYDRLVKAMGADALSVVESGHCTACHTEITAQSYNDVRARQFTFCKMCGRLLYLREEG